MLSQRRTRDHAPLEGFEKSTPYDISRPYSRERDTIQVVGTPDDCLQQIAELRRLTGMDHLVTEFDYGGMPHKESEVNMRLFADRVMSVIQRDTAFADASAPTRGVTTVGQRSDDIFAPA